MKTSSGSHFAPIIALTLVAVISAGTLITSYVNPSLFEQFEETGSSSGGKSGESGEKGDGKQADSGKKGVSSPEGEGLEGVTFNEVDEDEATLQAMLGNSKAFELEPWEGLKVSAEENALDHDRDFQITRLDDTKYDSLQEEFEDGGAFLLDAFDVNAGLQADEYLPGYYEVSMDLSTLGVPEELYPEEVENTVSKDPSVQDVIVIGYTQGGIPGERVGAIVYPNEDWFAAQNGGAKPSWEEMEKVVSKRVKEKSAELADYKRIRKVEVYHEPLVRTSVGKVRRVTYKGKLDE